MNHWLPWVILFSHLSVLLVLDFVVFTRLKETNKSRKALKETVFFVLNALAFTGVIYWCYDAELVYNPEKLRPLESVTKFLSGYFIELSLSVDNLFVIALIFASYKIPGQYQHRLLFLGIVGAISLRASLISVGLVLVHAISWMTIVFGLFLLYTAIKMIVKGDEEEEFHENKGLLRFFNMTRQLDGGNFRMTIDGKRMFTGLFAALVTIEFTDLLFALDSIPAIFAVTTDPFIVFSSNIFAIMGLRSLFFFLANMLEKFAYLKYSVFAILVYVSLKLIGAHWVEIPEWFSLAFITLCLAGGVWISLRRNKKNS
jgi:tellurite resistance protein TerC